MLHRRPFARALSGALACAWSATAVAQGTTSLAVAGRSNENVSIAARGKVVAIVWSATAAEKAGTPSQTDVFASVSADAGARFSSPVRVNAKPGEARVGGEQPPRVALVPGKSATHDVVVVWTARGPNGTRLLQARSMDGGKTFGASTLVPGGEGPGNRGWESVAVDSLGRVIAIWLDHRNVTPAPMHQHGAAAESAKAAPKPDPVARAELSQLWLASLDGAVKPGTVVGGVCYCCKTALVASGNRVYAAWRHVYPGNQRDIAFAASSNGGHTFGAVARVSQDKWEFDGCPENGPALTVDGGGRVHAAWVTPLDGKEGAPLALYHSVTADNKSFSPRERVATTGAAAHVQLATVGDGSVVLAWDEATAKGRRVRVARGTPDKAGRVTFKPAAEVSTEEGVNPALATSGKATIVAWVRRAGNGTTIGVMRVP